MSEGGHFSVSSSDRRTVEVDEPRSYRPAGEASPESQASLSSAVSSHSRQTHSAPRTFRALNAAGTIVTPQTGQIGGRSSSISEVWPGARRLALLRRTVRAHSPCCVSGEEHRAGGAFVRRLH